MKKTTNIRKTAYVYRNGEFLGEYSYSIAFEVAKDIEKNGGNAYVMDISTGEILYGKSIL